jgi:hypothetical protein
MVASVGVWLAVAVVTVAIGDGGKKGEPNKVEVPIEREDEVD